MIKALNGSTVTLVAGDEDIVPYSSTPEGDLKVAGRHTFNFKLLSGTLLMTVGVNSLTVPTGFSALTSHSTAGETWTHTASPEEKDGGKSNIHASGAGATFQITW